eukprot:903057-Pyramimonas_sp.AAC.1
MAIAPQAHGKPYCSRSAWGAVTCYTSCPKAIAGGTFFRAPSSCSSPPLLASSSLGACWWRVEGLLGASLGPLGG